jgi:hypothetical protein
MSRAGCFFWAGILAVALPQSVGAGSVYFTVVTLTGARWSGAFEVGDLSERVRDTEVVGLSTVFVGGLNDEPGYIFTSRGTEFVWQGDNDDIAANSTICSTELAAAVNAGIAWQELIGQDFVLLDDVTTDIAALNPTTLRLFGQGGLILFSDEPEPVPDAYTLWWLSYPGLTDTRPEADPDGDGFDNATEFAFDGDPRVPTPSLLQARATPDGVVFQFIARNDLFPQHYHVLSTTDLGATPFTGNADVTASIVDAEDQSGVPLSNDYTRKEFTVPLAAKGFFRVEATLGP